MVINSKLVNKINHTVLQYFLLLMTLCLSLTLELRPIHAATKLPDSPTTFYYDETNTLDETTKKLVQSKNLFYEKKSAAPQVILAVVKIGRASCRERV